MKNLHGFSTMLTYSRGIWGRCTKFPLHRPISCALSSQCVQARRGNGGVIAKLNFLLTTPCTSIKSLMTSSSGISVGQVRGYSRASPTTYTTQDEIGEESDRDELMESSRERELEKQRFIWNVGPAVRPSASIASFVNDSVLLQEFLKMGVELHKWDALDPKVVEFILKLDFERDVAPYIRFLCHNGVPPDELKNFFTKNPMILQEDLRNLNIRIKYLQSKSFTPAQIQSVITKEVFWLTMSTSEVDERLGYFQTTFKLNGDQIRELATKGSRTVTTIRVRLMEVTFKIKDEMGFEPREIVSILLQHPSIWRQRAETLWRRFDYVHNTAKFSHEMIARSPKLLLTREGRLRSRIGYLQHLGRAQFDATKPNFVSAEDIVSGDDAHFAVAVAKSSVVHFNEYLKST